MQAVHRTAKGDGRLNTATRLITLIMLMQRRPNQKASELARQLDVSIRSVHRYMAKLDNVLPDEQRHEVAWARRTLLATGMHRSDVATLAPLLEKLRRARAARRRVAMAYQ